MNQRTTSQPRVLLTIEQAAHQLSLSRATMFRLIKTGDIASVRIGRARRIAAEAIEDYVHRLSAEQRAA
ncbi:DNA-binding protein [Saccharopolyspora terrae]|uniref:DNA-binding protein n=1 Tax=Saccharopolyspora terrae TaxID=2530384 RepID=A0A4R4VQN4_9PSEU|nr:helix-turn-helix domain-containing protein [Saccharopolyspora terrae]TDD08112.1 DNA-binding protein [Saccharopolyspora terrae]